ncbi:hypothetical protein GCM10020255_061540 [Rhodococcus baikonurensis]
MSVVIAVLLVVVAGLVGYLVGRVLVPRLSSRQSQRSDEQTGLTMSQVLDLIVLASESGIAVVDGFHDVVLFNPRAEELGLVKNRLVDERAWRAAQEVLRTGQPVEVDLTAQTAQRGRDKIAVRGTARLLSKDDRNFVVLFADDDSEQVRMEATRRDFVANVSHELKTPVGAMSLLAEALLESADDPESVRHFGERVLGESIRLGKMVTELIALAPARCREAARSRRGRRRHRGVRGTVEVESVGRGRRDHRHHRPSEWVGGARGSDSSRDGTVQPHRERYCLLAQGVSGVSQSVGTRRQCRDRGHRPRRGIAKADQERVFERFFRVDKARSRQTGGTGLGLAIVKHVAANHNGSIELWSKPGTGSTFTLQIPAHVESDDDIDSDDAGTAGSTRIGRREQGSRENGMEAKR